MNDFFDRHIRLMIFATGIFRLIIFSTGIFRLIIFSTGILDQCLPLTLHDKQLDVVTWGQDGGAALFGNNNYFYFFIF